MIVHITTRTAWEQAQAAGSYAPASLAREGFIHFSDPGQVVGVAEAAYSRTPDLVLLCVNTERLAGPLRYAAADGDRFPHLYGELNLDAVVDVVPFARGEHGFSLPDALR